MRVCLRCAVEFVVCGGSWLGLGVRRAFLFVDALVADCIGWPMYVCVTCGVQLGVCPTLHIRVSNEKKKEGALYVGGGVRGGAAPMLFLVLGPLPPSPNPVAG